MNGICVIKYYEIFDYAKIVHKDTFNKTHKIDQQLTMYFASYLKIKYTTTF